MYLSNFVIRAIFFNMVACTILISCDTKSEIDFKNTTMQILSGTVENNLLNERSEIHKIHAKYAVAYEGSNDIVHFLNYIYHTSLSNEQAAFNSAFFVYELVNNKSDWSKSLFFIDKNELRRIINHFDAIYDASIYRELLIKSGADYIIQYDVNIVFEHFNFLNPNLNQVSTKDFGDKILVIDFGATWCSPCKEQAPYLEEIRKLFIDDDVQFISISLDKDQDKWLKYYSSTTKAGNLQHGIIDNANLEHFRLKYGLRGIPRYFIITKEGTYVTYDAPKPSSDIFSTLISQRILKK